MKKSSKIYLKILIFLVINIFILLLGCIQDSNGINTTIAEVLNDNDDARTFTVENNDLGYGNEDGYYETLQLSPSYSFGVRFINIDIPKGAEIINASVSIYSTGTPGHSHPNCIIYCDNTSYSVNFSECGVLNICGRNYTKSSVIWNTTVPYGEWVFTPSIKNLIQDIINRDDWEKGNPITVLFISRGFKEYSATFQNHEKGYPARLEIKWKNSNQE